MTVTRFSVFTASLPQWSPEYAVTQLASQGWDGVEWRVVDQEPSAEPGFWAGNRCTWPLATLEQDVVRIAELTRDAGLEISAVGGYALCDEAKDVERLLAATATLGAGRLRVRTPGLGGAPYPELFEHTRRSFVGIAERAAHHGVRALVELHHQTVVSSASAALRLLDGLDPTAVGVIHDLGNLVIEGGEDVRASLEMLGDLLAHVHVKNAAWRIRGQREDGTTEWVHEWADLAGGQADVPAYLRVLREVGYDGWVTLEDFTAQGSLAERTAASLAYLRAADRRAGQAV